MYAWDGKELWELAQTNPEEFERQQSELIKQALASGSSARSRKELAKTQNRMDNLRTHFIGSKQELSSAILVEAGERLKEMSKNFGILREHLKTFKPE